MVARSQICALRPRRLGATRGRASGAKETEWHRVVIFNENLCRVAEQYLKKGSKVYLEGQLQTRKWTDQQGVERYTTEVVLQNFRGELTLLDRAGGPTDAHDQGSDDFGAAGPTAGRERQPAMSGPRRNELDDDIPF